MSHERKRYFEILLMLGAHSHWVKGQEVAHEAKRDSDTVHKVLARMIKDGEEYKGLKLESKRAFGYRLEKV